MVLKKIFALFFVCLCFNRISFAFILIIFKITGYNYVMNLEDSENHYNNMEISGNFADDEEREIVIQKLRASATELTDLPHIIIFELRNIDLTTATNYFNGPHPLRRILFEQFLEDPKVEESIKRLFEIDIKYSHKGMRLLKNEDKLKIQLFRYYKVGAGADYERFDNIDSVVGFYINDEQLYSILKLLEHINPNIENDFTDYDFLFLNKGSNFLEITEEFKDNNWLSDYQFKKIFKKLKKYTEKYPDGILSYHFDFRVESEYYQDSFFNSQDLSE